MFQTYVKSYFITDSGTEITERELYRGASQFDAQYAFDSACVSFRSAWHNFSPRDRVVITMVGDGGVNLVRTFGE